MRSCLDSGRHTSVITAGPGGHWVARRHGTTHASPIRLPRACSSAGSSRPGQDLLIVGPGVLGQYLAKLWLDMHGPGTVTGLTQTTTHHARLRRLGIEPWALTLAPTPQDCAFANVAFCAPPSASPDYPGEVRRAAACWNGTGGLVFTSSAALYAVDDGVVADEASPSFALGHSARTDRLLLAEQEVARAGGCALRLVGLYHSLRGPHTFYLKKRGAVDRWGGALINLLHYQDAAALTLQALTRPAAVRNRVLVGCDDGPLTLQEIMEETLASPAGYAVADPADPVRLDGSAKQGRGKRMTNPGTRAALGGWMPEFPSFRDFMRSGGDDWYRGLEEAGDV